MQNQTIQGSLISPLPQLQNAVPIEQTETTGRYYDVYEVVEPNQVVNYWRTGNSFFFETENKVALEVRVFNFDVIRFRYAPKRKFDRDFSYALAPTFREDDDQKISFQTSSTQFSIITLHLVVVVDRSNLLISVYDKKGVLLNKDNAPFRAIYTLLHGLAEVKVSKMAYHQEVFLGLGDKASKLNLRGSIKQNWNTDAFAFDQHRDPMYRSIPFYFGLHSKIGYGIFMDNTYRSHFDFAATDPKTTTFFAEGGEMNYYFIYGPKLIDVAGNYAEMTGRVPMPPLWALGFHQCRWSYFPEARVREVAQEFRDRNIPCDAIYLDIDYMDGYRCFTWDEKHFPNPTDMIKDLEAQGFKTVVMIDPGLRVDENYEVYQSGLAIDAYCKRTSGELMVGPVWPPACVFPDFTRPDVRTWWGKCYEELYLKNGVSGFWNDMNEPAMFKVDRLTFPDEVLHDFDGAPTNHRKAHNIYGQQMSKATYEGLQALNPEKRPFLLSRATYCGGQRYAAIWTGDNVSSWEHLRLANIQVQRLSMSGFSFVGSDIGGFAGTPNGELMVRWLQLGVFHPLFRVHSMGNNVGGANETEQELIQEIERINRLDQEPWVFGEKYTALAKAAIELRYQLLPYLYTAFYEHNSMCTPIIRSLVLYDQEDPNTYDLESEFLFGESILVCPIELPCTLEGLILDTNNEDNTDFSEEETDEEAIIEESELILSTVNRHYLPKGNWYDFHTNQRLEGKQFVEVEVDLARIPMYILAGSIIPMYPVQQYVGAIRIELVTLKVYFDAEQKYFESMFFEDNGDGYDYISLLAEKNYTYRVFMQESELNKFFLTQFVQDYRNVSYQFLIQVIGLPFTPTICELDGEPYPFEQTNWVELTCPSYFESLTLR